MPNNSTVVLEVNITNLGNVEMGISSITGAPSNLKITPSQYTFKDRICDSQNSTKCKLGAYTTFYIIIEYTTNGYNSSETSYNLELNFDFRQSFNISYENVTDDSGLPKSILLNDSRDIVFDTTSGIPASVSVVGASADYTNSPTLVLSNPSGDVIVTASQGGGGTGTPENPY